jgi:hypothetical protein
LCDYGEIRWARGQQAVIVISGTAGCPEIIALMDMYSICMD